jgi:hypothetical protein
LCCTGDSGSSKNILDNIYYFSEDNSDNNGGSTSNSNDNSENDGDSTSNSKDNSDRGNNNSNGDLNPDYDEDQDCIEVEDHNGPEEVINDLEIIDRAKKK